MKTLEMEKKIRQSFNMRMKIQDNHACILFPDLKRTISLKKNYKNAHEMMYDSTKEHMNDSKESSSTRTFVYKN
jgi:hypothetical protein